MPAATLLTLLDDITSVLDDVAVLTKVATKKTAGVLGDDLALNAQQVTGVASQRELPVVWAVARGSVVNKAILVPAALVISQFIPWAVAPLLMIGGAYLCFEGFEKVLHVLSQRRDSGKGHGKHRGVSTETLQRVALENAVQLESGGARMDALAERAQDHARVEREKVKGAVRTDFVLSAEIVTIALGSVETAPFTTRLLVLTAISLVMTIGVYGLVAIIVKLDDLGAYLCTVGAKGHFRRMLGKTILVAAPWLLKCLSFAGTLAMFLVGGGIMAHGAPWLSSLEHWVLHRLQGVGTFAHAVAEALLFAAIGLLTGALVWVAVEGGKAVIKLRTRRGASS